VIKLLYKQPCNCYIAVYTYFSSYICKWLCRLHMGRR